MKNFKLEARYVAFRILIWALLPLAGVLAFGRGLRRGLSGKAPRGR